MLGPVIAVAIILTVMAIIANIFTVLYFCLIGWFCEVGICDCHDKFIVNALSAPWIPLIEFSKKIIKFLKDPLIT
jgi:hypothetical protein